MKKTLFLAVCLLLLSTISLTAQRPLRILAIGNSFSEDAVAYLAKIACAADVDLTIGNLYIGGCSLKRHYANLQTNDSAYLYTKQSSKTGLNESLPNTSLQTALLDEEWDWITLQQVSQESGIMESYFPEIEWLIAQIRTLVPNPSMRYALHAVWAYAADSDHGGFASYHNNQTEMYHAVTATSSAVARKTGITTILPSGTAIQNARSSFLGDTLCRDGYHLSLLGRYIAGCVWFESLSGISSVGNTFVPEGVTRQEAQLGQQAAHRAILSPERVSPMQDWK